MDRMHIRDNLKAVQVGVALPVYINCIHLSLVLRCCMKASKHEYTHTHRHSPNARSTCWSKLSSTGGPGCVQNLSRHSHDLSPSAREGRTSKPRTTGRSSTTSLSCHEIHVPTLLVLLVEKGCLLQLHA